MKTMIWTKPGVRRLVLLLSGLIATAIAGTILMAPGAFYSTYGIEIAGNTDLINELKAPAGMLLLTGLLMLAGVFRSELTVASLMTATTVYLSYGMSRLSSIALDGLPHSGLVEAAVLEIVIGAVCLFALLPELTGRNAHPSR